MKRRTIRYSSTQRIRAAHPPQQAERDDSEQDEDRFLRVVTLPTQDGNDASPEPLPWKAPQPAQIQRNRTSGVRAE